MFLPMFSPEDAITSGSGELDTNSIIKALDGNESESDNEEGNEPPVEEEVKEEKKEEVDELAELELDLKEPTDDDLELKVPVQRRELAKDYPGIFKKHPGLESTIYRERAYTELLPTINDAKEALGALNTLERFEADLKQGKTVDIMKAVLADDPNAFGKLADNYLDNLAAVDERAFHHVVGNMTKRLVKEMFAFAESDKNEDVAAAATILYKFMFNSTKWEGEKKLSSDVKDDSLTNERNKFLNEKKSFEESKSKEQTEKVMTSITNQMKGTIEKSIDTKNRMTSFVKSKAVDEIMLRADDLIKKDTRFQAIMKLAWDKAKKEGYSESSLQRIRSTYFNKYNGIVVPIAKAVKSEALKGTTVRLKSSEKEELNDTTERANRVIPDHDGKNNDYSKKPKPGESSRDFLLRRAR